MAHPIRSAFALVAAAAWLAAAPAPATAAPADIARAPDLTFEPCQARGMPPFEGTCTVQGFGDFNGDGTDDVVVEQAAAARAPAGADAPVVRTFVLLIGPFSGSDGPSKRIEVRVEPGEGGVNLTIADVDGDGKDDLALAALYRDLGGPALLGHQRVGLVMGRAALAPRYELGRLDGATSTLRRTIAATSSEAIGQIMLADVQAAFGDVNGDGWTDVALGNGIGAALGQAVAIAPARPADDPVTAPATASVAVAYGPIRWEGATVLTPAVQITRLGPCPNALGGVADVTGDGIDDVVFTQCPGQRLPDAVQVLAGSAALAGTVAAAPVGARGPVAPPRPILALGDSEVPPPGEPGRGYLPGGAAPDPSGRPLFLEDVDADGVRDIVLGFGANAHVWLGGPDVGARVAARRTDRVIVGAGFGALARTRAWHWADMDGNGVRDVLLVQPLPLPAAVGRAGADPAPGMRGGADPAAGIRARVEIFAGERAAVDVLDTDLDAPDAVWPSLASLDGMADVDGDGFTDLVWSAPSKAGATLSIHHGPLFGRR